MVDLTEEERAAITATMKRVALLMDEIGWATPLADLTEAQVRALIEEAVEGFRQAIGLLSKQGRGQEAQALHQQASTLVKLET